MTRLDEIKSRLQAMKDSRYADLWGKEGHPVDHEGCDVWPFDSDETQTFVVNTPDDVEWLLEAVGLAEHLAVVVEWWIDKYGDDTGLPTVWLDAYRAHVLGETPDA